MGVFAGPDISESGLVLALDAGNVKSYDRYENLLSNSIRTTDFSGATSGTGWTITANNSTSPDGTTTATLLTQTSSLTNSAILWINGGNSGGQVMSIFCKPVSGSATIQGQTGNGDGWTANLSTNTFTDGSSNGRHANGSVESYPNGWKRVSIPMFNVPPLATGSDFVGGDFYLTISGTGSVLLWGWQRETGSVATDYYQTSGSSKTRGTILTDLSGRGNTGTLTNGPTFNSSNGGSIVFDGANDYIDCGLSSFQPTAITLCAWVKHTVNGDGGIIVKGDVNEATEWGLSFGYSNPWLLVGRATASNNQLTYSWSGSLLTGFHYVCYTMVNNTRASLYVDGVQVATTNTIGSIGLNAKNVLIGKWNNYAPLNGSVAQAKIYNRELTAAEIQQNFNATRGRFGI